jgi:hypothetical protein
MLFLPHDWDYHTEFNSFETDRSHIYLRHHHHPQRGLPLPPSPLPPSSVPTAVEMSSPPSHRDDTDDIDILAPHGYSCLELSEMGEGLPWDK